MRACALAVSVALMTAFAPAAAVAATPPGCDDPVPARPAAKDPVTAGGTQSPNARAAGDDPAVTPGAPICDGSSYDYDYPNTVGATDVAAAIGGGIGAPTGQLPRTGSAEQLRLVSLTLLGFLTLLTGIALTCVPNRPKRDSYV